MWSSFSGLAVSQSWGAYKRKSLTVACSQVRWAHHLFKQGLLRAQGGTVSPSWVAGYTGLSWAPCPGRGVCPWPWSTVSGNAVPLATTGGQFEPTTSLLELVIVRLYWLPVWWACPGSHAGNSSSTVSLSDKKAEIDILAAEYISTVKTLSSDQRVEHLQKIQSAYNKCKVKEACSLTSSWWKIMCFLLTNSGHFSLSAAFSWFNWEWYLLELFGFPEGKANRFWDLCYKA